MGFLSRLVLGSDLNAEQRRLNRMEKAERHRQQCLARLAKTITECAAISTTEMAESLSVFPVGEPNAEDSTLLCAQFVLLSVNTALSASCQAVGRFTTQVLRYHVLEYACASFVDEAFQNPATTMARDFLDVMKGGFSEAERTSLKWFEQRPDRAEHAWQAACSVLATRIASLAGVEATPELTELVAATHKNSVRKTGLLRAAIETARAF